MKPMIRKAHLNEFRNDPGNANLHTELGESMVKNSIDERGVARPILASNDGVILAGELSKRTMEDVGFTDAIVIETDGSIPIIHVRKDLVDSNDPKARTLAIEDNRAAQVSLNWDGEKLLEAEVGGVQLYRLFRQSELAAIVIPEGDTEEGKAEINQTLSSAKSVPIIKFGKYALGLIQEEVDRLTAFLVDYQERNKRLEGAFLELVAIGEKLADPNPALAEMAAAQMEQEGVEGDPDPDIAEDEAGFDEDDEELYVEDGEEA